METITSYQTRINSIKQTRDIIKKLLFPTNSLDTFIKYIISPLSFIGYDYAAYYYSNIKYDDDPKYYDSEGNITKEGITMISKWQVDKNMSSLDIVTKINFYAQLYPPSNNDNRKKTPQPDTAIKILEILRDEFLFTNKTPCIIGMIYHQIYDSSEIAQMTPDDCITYKQSDKLDITNNVYALFCRHRDMVKIGLEFDKVSFMAMELGDKTLSDFILQIVKNNNNSTLISILFQLIWTFYIITKKYPSFRHHDLHTDNIVINFDLDLIISKLSYIEFKIIDADEKCPDGSKCKCVWRVPYFGYNPLIIDFGFSTLEEKGIVSDINDDKFRLKLKHPTSDILYLLASIKNIARSKRVDALCAQLDPTEYYKYADITMATDVPIKTMLHNSLFDIYKNIDTDNIYATFA